MSICKLKQITWQNNTTSLNILPIYDKIYKLKLAVAFKLKFTKFISYATKIIHATSSSPKYKIGCYIRVSTLLEEKNQEFSSPILEFSRWF